MVLWVEDALMYILEIFFTPYNNKKNVIFIVRLVMTTRLIYLSSLLECIAWGGFRNYELAKILKN